jgi:hypothetical protein
LIDNTVGIHEKEGQVGILRPCWREAQSSY